MPLAVPRRALDQRRVIRHARLLARPRNAVDVAAECDDRASRAPRRPPGGRDPRDAVLHLEAVLAQDAGDVARGLHLLEAELGEGEDLVHHHLHELAAPHHVRLDLGQKGLQTIGIERGGGAGLGVDPRRQQQQGDEKGGGGANHGWLLADRGRAGRGARLKIDQPPPGRTGVKTG